MLKSKRVLHVVVKRLAETVLTAVMTHSMPLPSPAISASTVLITEVYSVNNSGGGCVVSWFLMQTLLSSRHLMVSHAVCTGKETTFREADLR
jgi:hypothetical protein